MLSLFRLRRVSSRSAYRHLKNSCMQCYELLQEVRLRGNWEAWIEFFLRGIEETVTQAVETARRIRYGELLQSCTGSSKRCMHVAGKRSVVLRIVCSSSDGHSRSRLSVPQEALTQADRLRPDYPAPLAMLFAIPFVALAQVRSGLLRRAGRVASPGSAFIALHQYAQAIAMRRQLPPHAEQSNCSRQIQIVYITSAPHIGDPVRRSSRKSRSTECTSLGERCNPRRKLR